MYKDLYLRFADEAEAAVVLLHHNEVNGEVVLAHKYRNIDVVGVIYKSAPDPLPDDYVPIAIPGWHVNVRLMDDEDDTALLPFSVVPTVPRRVWG